MLRSYLSIQFLSKFPSLKNSHRTVVTAASQMTTFDERWKKLTQAEKDLVAKEYEHLQKGDWKGLTIDQKRIRKTSSKIIIIS